MKVQLYGANLSKHKYVHIVNTDKDLSIHVSITTVGLILTKLRWSQHFGLSKNSISTFIEKKLFFLFLCCSTREDLSIDVSFTNVGLILTKLGWFLFSGCGQTYTTRWIIINQVFRNNSSYGNFYTMFMSRPTGSWQILQQNLPRLYIIFP